MNGVEVLGWRKTPTMPDVGVGAVEVLRDLLAETCASAAEIQAVMIGTTHFTNAIVERRRLVEVAAVRLGLPATRSLLRRRGRRPGVGQDRRRRGCAARLSAWQRHAYPRQAGRQSLDDLRISKSGGRTWWIWRWVRPSSAQAEAAIPTSCA